MKPTPNRIEKRIPPERIETLRSLVGEKVSSIYSPTLEVSGPYYRSPSFSIKPSSTNWDKHKWLIFTNSLFETRDGLSCFELRIAIDTTPKDIIVKNYRERNHITWPFSSIDLDITSPIEKIELFQVEDYWQDRPDEENEFVIYDSGLIFTLNNGFSFWLGVYDSIIEHVEVSLDEKELSDIRNEMAIRATFG